LGTKMRDLEVDRSSPASQPPSIEIKQDSVEEEEEDEGGKEKEDEDNKDKKEAREAVRISAKSTPASPNAFRDLNGGGGRDGLKFPGRLSPALFAKLGKCNSEPDMLIKKQAPDMSRSCHNGIVLCLQVQEEREASSSESETGDQQRPGRRPEQYEGGAKSDSEDSSNGSSGGGMIMIPDHQNRMGGNTQAPPPPPPPDMGGLIMPRKIHNPCMESSDRQNLHRELLFNQRIGKNVLNQKSELQKALEKHKDNQARKDLEMQKLEEKTPLERVIEERAKRLESYEKGSLENESKSSSEKPEFLQVHARLRARMDSK
ncbi:hypothetical protein LSTR_LSTR010551, partial [Laodelphax striatellus]